MSHPVEQRFRLPVDVALFVDEYIDLETCCSEAFWVSEANPNEFFIFCQNDFVVLICKENICSFIDNLNPPARFPTAHRTHPADMPREIAKASCNADSARLAGPFLDDFVSVLRCNDFGCQSGPLSEVYFRLAKTSNSWLDHRTFMQRLIEERQFQRLRTGNPVAFSDGCGYAVSFLSRHLREGASMSVKIPGDLDLSDVISTLALHDHLCLIYETPEQQAASAIPFVLIGIERGQSCLYVADENKTAILLDAMRAEGVDHGPKRAWAVVVHKRPTQNWRETCSHRL